MVNLYGLHNRTELEHTTKRLLLATSLQIKGVTYLGDAEDEESVAANLTFMARELHKANPDWDKIRVSMECTFHERRNWMDATQPLVADIVDKYPALGYAQAVRIDYLFISYVCSELYIFQEKRNKLAAFMESDELFETQL